MKAKIRPLLAHLGNTDPTRGPLGSPKTSQNEMLCNVGMYPIIRSVFLIKNQ